MNNVIVHIDGGSRGNPGPAGIGVLFSEGGRKVKEYSQFIGEATNNEAEYQSLIFALKKLKAVFGGSKVKEMDVEVRSDSELLVKQMNGEYKIKEERIRELFLTAWNLKVEFKKISFVSVLREKNKEADRLVNEALDGALSKKTLFD